MAVKFLSAWTYPFIRYLSRASHTDHCGVGCQHLWPHRPDIDVRQTITRLILNGKSTKCHDEEVHSAWELLIEDLERPGQQPGLETKRMGV